jgi:hypothetical protein
MNGRVPLPYLTAFLQIIIAVIFMFGYFGFLAILFLGHVTIQSDLLELGKTLAVGLSGALGLLFAFLYLRSREAGQADPGTTTSSVQSTTIPVPGVPPNAPIVPIQVPVADPAAAPHP